MKVSPISFGKIVKLNQPKYIGYNIADIANNNSGKFNSKTDKKIQKLFPDKKEHQVIATEVNDENSTYLFSGEEGKKANKILEQMYWECEHYCTYYHGEDDLVQPAFETACQKAGKDLKALVHDAKKITVLNIELEEGSQRKIKSIDIKG